MCQKAMRAVKGSSLQRYSWRLAATLLAYLAATHSVAPSFLCTTLQSRGIRGAFRLREARTGISPLLRLRGGKDDPGEGDSMLDSASAPNSVISESDSRVEVLPESDGAVHNEDASEKVKEEESGERGGDKDSETSKDDTKEIPDPDTSDLEDSFRSSDRCASRLISHNVFIK